MGSGKGGPASGSSPSVGRRPLVVVEVSGLSVVAARRVIEIEDVFVASLDHTIWFHHPLRADAWHLYDFSCHHIGGGRGMSIGHVFGDDGTHVATVAQEVLVRDGRDRA